jgi:hypothetical protein
MTFKDLQINDLLITELYSKVLVDIPVKQQANPSTADAISFLGNNQKNILIVVNEPNAVFLKDDDLALLTGILSACKLSLADTAIVNVSHAPVDYKILQEQFKPSVFLIFGTDLKQLDLPLHFPQFQLQSYNGQKLLSAPSLSIMSIDVPLKKQLWTILKQLFTN